MRPIDADELYDSTMNVTDVSALAAAILVAPAIDAAPVVHGRWIDTGLCNSTGNIYKCSVCGMMHNPNEDDCAQGRAIEMPSFCYGCGAKMDVPHA